MRKILAVVMLLMMVAMCGVVIAAEATVDPAEAAPQVNLAMCILKGALMGAIATVIGWAKKTDMDKFKWEGLIVKVPIGAIVGGIASYQGVTFDTAMQWATTTGLITVLDQVVKLILRRVAGGYKWEILNLEAPPKK